METHFLNFGKCDFPEDRYDDVRAAVAAANVPRRFFDPDIELDAYDPALELGGAEEVDESEVEDELQAERQMLIGDDDDDSE